MKRYLDLVPISAKVHVKQNRMSVFCIVLAVFLVTVIFGMADMFIRSQIIQAQKEEGNLHISIKNISDEKADIITLRPEIKYSAWYGVLNYEGDLDYHISDKNAVICGSDESFITEMQVDMLTEGVFPQTSSEALVTENAKNMLDLKIGDTISIDTPGKTVLSYTISGFMKNVSKLMSEDSYGIFLTTEGFRSMYPGVVNGEPADYNSVFYVQFSNHNNIRETIRDIKLQFELSDEQVSENTKLLGLLLQSGSSFMLQIYGSAAILFVLVLLAGIMMISSSLNSNISQRIEFFGMIRCIGASPKQIMRLVHREAFYWCKFAIPAGVGAGVIIIWVLSGILRFLSPEYFGGMPVFSISLPSIFSGIMVGIMTVVLAARLPAKRASEVSPLSAVTGNAGDLRPVSRGVTARIFKVDTALGIHHARSSRKNFILTVSSFSLSIILFLSFSVTVDFAAVSFTPLDPWAPDISVVSPDNTCSIENGLLIPLKENPAVKQAYGRMFANNIPGTFKDKEKNVDLISYEEIQFEWAKKYLIGGSVEAVKNEENTGFAVYDPQSEIRVGDTVVLNIRGQQKEIKIAGILSECPFNNTAGTEKIICSESTFLQLTGQKDYTVIDIQLTKKAADKDVDEIRKLFGSKYTFSDERLGNKSVWGIYYCFGLFVYGFLAVIALITVFNIINSIGMSIAARMKQYGALRSIGLSSRQLMKMIIAEAFTYAFTGSVFGTILGLVLNKILFEKMITSYRGIPWSVPFAELGIIVFIVAVSVVLAVWSPVRKISRMSIVDTINAK